MTKLVLAAALMLGTAAVAQTAPEATTEAETTTEAQATTTAPATSTSTTTSMSAEGGTTVAPGNAAPERDARGIAVVSEAATAPAGANQPVAAPPGAQVVASANQSAVFATRPAEKEYPVCSRTVTDGCVQAYERGSRPR